MVFRPTSLRARRQTDESDLQPAVALSIRGAGCSIAGRAIFSGVDLEIKAGERVHLAGANGAGKSTVLRCISGTMPLSTGMVRIAGHPAGSLPARTVIGSCIEPERGLYQNLSGRDNLLFAARLRSRGQDVREAVRGVEVELGISDFAAEKVRHYSAGMRARISIARALLGDPLLLLLDEPTRSLDQTGRELLWSALRRRRSVACLVTSHLPSDQLECDHSLTLAGGR